jgi:hypothetical protein
VLKGSETELRFGDVKNDVSYAAASYRTVRSEVGTDAMRKIFGLQLVFIYQPDAQFLYSVIYVLQNKEIVHQVGK